MWLKDWFGVVAGTRLLNVTICFKQQQSVLTNGLLCVRMAVLAGTVCSEIGEAFQKVAYHFG